MVSSATSDLNKLTACGKALVRYGGQAFVDECKPHTNVAAGDIVCTNSGNLPSQFVIHAVCCHWNNNQGAAEQVLYVSLMSASHDSNVCGILHVVLYFPLRMSF